MECDLEDLARQRRIDEMTDWIADTNALIDTWAAQDRKALEYALQQRDNFFDLNGYDSTHYI
ncbi:MAG: hypothetical protein V1743_01530 [Nanoarchaeota archaeon]